MQLPGVRASSTSIHTAYTGANGDTFLCPSSASPRFTLVFHSLVSAFACQIVVVESGFWRRRVITLNPKNSKKFWTERNYPKSPNSKIPQKPSKSRKKSDIGGYGKWVKNLEKSVTKSKNLKSSQNFTRNLQKNYSQILRLSLCKYFGNNL